MYLLIGASLLVLIILNVFLGATEARAILRVLILGIIVVGLLFSLANRKGQSGNGKPIVVANEAMPSPGASSGRRSVYHSIVGRTPEGDFAGGYMVVMIQEGRNGYSRDDALPTGLTYDQARAAVEQLNRSIGVSSSQKNRIVSRWRVD